MPNRPTTYWGMKVTQKPMNISQKCHLPRSSSQHAAEQLRIPVVEAGEPGEHGRAEEHLVEVGHHEVGVVGGEVDGRRGQHDAGDAAHQEGEQEPDAEQHGRGEA